MWVHHSQFYLFTWFEHLDCSQPLLPQIKLL